MPAVSPATGGNRGIGREVCRQLADQGQTVLPTTPEPCGRCHGAAVQAGVGTLACAGSAP